MLPRETITDEQLIELEALLNMKLGSQLIDYLKQYGKLPLEYERDVNGYRQGDVKECSLVRETMRERTFYPNVLDKYIVIENDGFGNLYLIDSGDNMYFFNHETKLLEDLHKSFNAYLEEIIKGSN
ncbi:MAG: SMI1/KNR4 family protein [Clostridiales bacterium]|jgi:hypothetical protein|nr:SMI1/KNR4 family protein [Clostridiales bacterium]